MLSLSAKAWSPYAAGISVGNGKLLVSDLIGIPYWTAALALAAVIVPLLIALERWFPSSDELGRDVDGDIAPPVAERKNLSAAPAE